MTDNAIGRRRWPARAAGGWTLLVFLVCAAHGGAVADARAAGQAAAQTAIQTPAPPEPLPEAPEKETFVMTCGVCHEVDTAIGTRRTAADWQLVIDAMINRGALGTEDEFTQILAYLTKHFIVVNVNTADAAEVAKVLELPPAAAEALVAYRKEHGPFTSPEDVKRVPGLDAKAIDDRKPRLAFK